MRRWFMLFFIFSSITFLSGCLTRSYDFQGFSNTTIVVGTPFDPMEGISLNLVDFDGSNRTRRDITDEVTVRFNNVNVNVPGTYEVEYQYPIQKYCRSNDSDCRINAPEFGTQLRIVTVIPHEPQISGLNNQRILLGSEFNDRQGITVTSYYDGNLTDELKVEGTVNVNLRGEYPLTYRVSDSDGRETVQTITVRVFTQTPPALSIIDGVTNAQGEIEVPLTLEGYTDGLPNFDHFVRAVDVEGIDISDDIVRDFGTVLVNQLGSYVLVYSVFDMDGNGASFEMTVVVVPNQSPVINQTDFTVWQHDFTEFNEKLTAFSATDPEDGDVTDRVTWDLGNIDLRTPGVYAITYTAIDKNGGVGTRVVNVTVREDLPPVITGLRDFSYALRQLPPSTTVLLEGITVTDDKDGDLTSALRVYNNVRRFTPGTYQARYFITDSGGNRVIETVTITLREDTDPFFEGLESRTINTHSFFDPLEGVIAHDAEDGALEDITVTGVVNTSVRGDYDLTYSVTDSDGNTTEVTITITVFSDTPPVIQNARDFTLYEKDVSPFFAEITRVTASDFEDGNLTSAVTLEGDFNLNNPGIYTLTYRVSDSDDNEASVSVTVTVLEDLPPVINGVTDVAVTVGDAFDLLTGITVEDDRDAPETIELTFVDDVDVNTPGTYTVTYTAIDRIGNTTTATATVTVLAGAVNEAPVISGAVDIVIFQGDVFSLLTAFDLVTVSDLEDGDLTASLTVTGIEAIDLTVLGSHTITYTVTDSGGLTTTEDVTLTIIKAPDPTFSGVMDLEFTEGDMLTAFDLEASVMAIDYLGGPALFSLITDLDISGPIIQGSYTITYTAMDIFGNQSVTSASITVNPDAGSGGGGSFGPASTILEALEADGSYTIFLQAISASGLTATLSGDGPFTVFAPKDTAFNAYFSDEDITLEQFLSSSTLSAIIGDHIVSGQAIDFATLETLSELTMLSGNTLSISSGFDPFMPSVIVENAIVAMGTDEAIDNDILYGITDVIVFGTGF